MTWAEYYKKTYAPLLTSRASGAKRGLVEGFRDRSAGFELMFKLLFEQKQKDFSIIETGTLRNPGNWKDGQSGAIFADLIDQYGGTLTSIDIDSLACKRATDAIGNSNVSVVCGDSVQWLQTCNELDTVDLFYLDSWDVKWENDQPSAVHHLSEFISIEPYLGNGTVVAIDDNSRFLSGHRTGKGRLIFEYLQQKGILPLYDAYQIIYQF